MYSRLTCHANHLCVNQAVGERDFVNHENDEVLESRQYPGRGVGLVYTPSSVYRRTQSDYRYVKRFFVLHRTNRILRIQHVSFHSADTSDMTYNTLSKVEAKLYKYGEMGAERSKFEEEIKVC